MKRERTKTAGITKVTYDSGEVRYRLVVDAGTNPATGKRDQRCSTHRTLTEARSERSRILADRDRGTLVRQDKTLTVQRAVDDWLATLRDVRPSTVSAYESALLHLTDALGYKHVGALTKADLEQLVSNMLSGEARRRGKAGEPLGARSVRDTLDRTAQVLDGLVEEGVLGRNVARMVKRPKLPPRGEHAWTVEEARTFLDHVAEDRLYPCWLLSLFGLRRGEIMGLTWSNVDLDGGVLWVEPTRVTVAGQVLDSEAKTAAGKRRIPVAGTGVVEALRAHRKRLAAERLAAERLAGGKAYTVSDLVAVDEIGCPVHPERYSRTFQRLAKAAKVRVIKLHDARHTAATLLAGAGVRPEVVSAFLGHTDAAFTLRKYTDVPADALADAGTALGAVLAGAV